MAGKVEGYIPLPSETRAFTCGFCGAVSLTTDGICNVQGRLTRGDWCGTKSLEPPKFCQNRAHNLRFKCGKCGRVAVDAGLLCEPEQMPQP
jgi:ribosomal protein S27AE